MSSLYQGILLNVVSAYIQQIFCSLTRAPTIT